MAHLFSPLTIAGKKLANRIVMAPFPSGYASEDGFIGNPLYDYYLQRAHGHVGLIIIEAAHVMPPPSGAAVPHIGLYDDMFIPQLRRLAQAVHGTNSFLLVMLDAAARRAHAGTQQQQELAASFLRAAWRAQAADCDGVVLSAADGGVLHMLASPLYNRRNDAYGGSATNRLRLPIEIIEGIRTWLGPRFLMVFRMVAEEFDAGGITLQDARVNARRLVAAGVHVLDIMTDTRSQVSVARFPAWQVPLAEGIKRVIPDVPVMCSGLLGDPLLADSVVRDGSIDLVMLGSALRENPYWAHIARIVLDTNSSHH